VFPGYTADDQKPWLVSRPRRDFDQIGISPKRLGIDEIDAMFFAIDLAFRSSNSKTKVI
jgi:hypothetical protein